MSAPKSFTPGPWDFSPRTLNVSRTDMDAIGQPTTGVAVVYGMVGDDEVNATGNLIAAAPDLVDVLSAYVAAINDNHFAKNYVPADVRRNACALLAKVRGES